MNLQEFENCVRKEIKDELMAANVFEVVNDGLQLLSQPLSEETISSYYIHCYQLLEDSNFDMNLFKQQMSLQNYMVRRVYRDYAKDRVNQEKSKWLMRMTQKETQIKRFLQGGNIIFKTLDGSIIPDDSKLYHDIAYACIRFYEYPKESYAAQYGICRDEIAFCKLINSVNQGHQIEQCVMKDVSGELYKMSSSHFINVFVEEFMPFFKERHLVTTDEKQLEKIAKAFKYEQGKIANRLIRELVHVFVRYNILKESQDHSDTFDQYHLDNYFNPEITYAANPILDLMFHMGYLQRGPRFVGQPGLVKKEYKDRIEEALKAKTLQCVFDLQRDDMFNFWLFT